MNQILALIDPDTSYTERFSRYLSHRPELPYTVYTFQDFDSLHRFSDRNSIDLLLNGDEQRPEQASLIHARDTVLLSSDPTPKSQGSTRCIYKYQSGDSLLKEIFANYDSTMIKNSRRNPSAAAKLYLVFSPIGRCGKTGFSLGLSQELAKSRRVLYISFEESAEFMPEHIQDKATLSELLYLFKEHRLDRKTIEDALIQHNPGGFSLLQPVRMPDDLSVLNDQELSQFVEMLRDLSGMDAIILDTDSIPSRYFSIFTEADRIFMPVSAAVQSKGKLPRFEAMLQNTPRFRNVNNKIIKLLVPDTPLPEVLSSQRMQKFTAAVAANYLIS